MDGRIRRRFLCGEGGGADAGGGGSSEAGVLARMFEAGHDRVGKRFQFLCGGNKATRAGENQPVPWLRTRVTRGESLGSMTSESLNVVVLNCRIQRPFNMGQCEATAVL